MRGPGCTGHGVCTVRPSGGFGMISIWVTERAFCRMEVPTQSEPVSPPPITMTSLPVARMSVPSGIASPATRWLDWVRNVIANSTPDASRPGIGRSRGFVEPPARTTASNSASSCAAGWSTPTWTPVRNVTPSVVISSMRRSRTGFDSLKSGIP